MLEILMVTAFTACLAPYFTHAWNLPRSWLALIPASLFAYSMQWWVEIISGGAIVQSWQWMPYLGLNLSFYIDGLSFLFVALITGIGSFVVLYASSYLKNARDEGKFLFWLFIFMAAMLGLVTSNNLLSLFVFWELTSFTSFMLIGFNHESEKSRQLAFQGLFVTVGGGLLLMTGFIMLGSIAGSYELSEIITLPIYHESLYVDVMLVLILLGALTKSAQFPFYFWLPNAMAAPTPVSAFLHSATMVKAGVFLMARLNPTFAEQDLWSNIQLCAGSITMLLGAVFAYLATDLKKVLAYTTIMALGTLTLLLGLGSEYALIGFVTYLLAHSLYKASMFMLAGGIDHATGTKDLNALAGLRQVMPLTCVLVILGSLSLAGLPPLFGFIGKELVLEAGLKGGIEWMVAIVIASSVVVGVAINFATKIFFGKLPSLPKVPHELPIAMLAGPFALLTLSMILGVMPSLVQNALVQSAVLAITGEAVEINLKIWHGFNTALMLSITSAFIGIVLASLWLRSRSMAATWNGFSDKYGPERVYFLLMDGIALFSKWQTRILQNGRLGIYMLVLLIATLGPVAWILFHSVGSPIWKIPVDMSFYEWIMVALLILSTVFAVITHRGYASIISLGVMGFAVALIFIHFSAPDLGITQVLVETLTVLLLALILVKVPDFVKFSSTAERVRDATVASFAGFVMSWIVLSALPIQWAPSISEYFIDNSYELGKGRNIVNVILVDFRALDTLGEIFVLAIAALGVHSMLKLREGHSYEKN